jgi:hypothetical protein
MTTKFSFIAGGENPKPAGILAATAGQEYRFSQIQFSGNQLHLPVIQPFGLGNYCQLRPIERRPGEHVYYVIVNLQIDSLFDSHDQ